MIRTTLRRIGYSLFATLALATYAGQAQAVEAERFEVASVKAPVRSSARRSGEIGESIAMSPCAGRRRPVLISALARKGF